MENYHRVSEVAKKLNFTRQYIYQLIKKNRIKTINIAGLILIDDEEYIKLVKLYYTKLSKI